MEPMRSSTCTIRGVEKSLRERSRSRVSYQYLHTIAFSKKPFGRVRICLLKKKIKFRNRLLVTLHPCSYSSFDHSSCLQFYRQTYKIKEGDDPPGSLKWMLSGSMRIFTTALGFGKYLSRCFSSIYQTTVLVSIHKSQDSLLTFAI